MRGDIQTRPAPPADERLAYGDDPSQFGDLRLPKSRGPHPLVVVLHGGWWHSEADLGYMGHLAAALASQGMATWNVEFRRLGATGGGWPYTFLDVADAVDHVAALARRFPIDTSRIALVGHSSGGHLAMWVAGRRNVAPSSGIYRPPRSTVGGVICVAGAVDLRMAQSLGFRDGFTNRPVVEDLLGGSPDHVPERYRAASPTELLPLGVPQVLLHGTSDEITPIAVTERYLSAARISHDRVTYIRIAGADHFDPIDPESRAFSYVRDAALDLVEASLRQPVRS